MGANPCLEVVTAELKSAGIPFRVDQGGKHLRVQYGQNHEHLHVVSATPSDWRAPLNERAQIRKELRKFGLVAADAEAERPAIVPVQLVDGEPACFSYDIAADFGKAHKDVLRAIDRLREECGEEFDRRNFAPISYTDPRGRSYRAFRLTRDGFSLVVMGFTGPDATTWKVRYVGAFNAMASELQRLALASANGLVSVRSDIEALTDLIGEVERRVPASNIIALPVPTRREVKRSLRRYGWRTA